MGKTSLRRRLLPWIGLLILGSIVNCATWHSSSPLIPDSCQYIVGGIGMMSGTGFLDMSGQPQTIFPPGYPIAVGLASKLIPGPVIAARLVSVVASILAIIPLVLLSARLFGRRVGFAAGLIYMVLPERVTVSNLAVTESLYLLLLLSALWLWLRETEGFRWGRSAAIGGLLGAAYLVRPEAMICAAVLLALSLPFHRRWPTLAWRSMAVSLAVLVIVAAPYVIYLHSHTGQWSVSGKASVNQGIAVAQSRGIPWEKTVRLDSTATGIDFSAFTETRQEFAKRYLRNLRREAAVLAGTLGPFLTVCLILGGAIECMRGSRTLRQSPPVILVLSLPLAFVPAFFVASRFVYSASIPIVMLACWQLMKRFRADPDAPNSRALSSLPLLLVALSFLAVDAQTARTPAQSVATANLSTWVRSNTPTSAALMDFNPERAFFAGRRWFPLPYDTLDRTLHYARSNGANYLLLRSGVLLSPEMQDVARRRNAPSLRLVAEWGDGGGAWAKLYRVVTPPTR